MICACGCISPAVEFTAATGAIAAVGGVEIGIPEQTEVQPTGNAVGAYERARTTQFEDVSLYNQGSYRGLLVRRKWVAAIESEKATLGSIEMCTDDAVSLCEDGGFFHPGFDHLGSLCRPHF